MTQVGQGSNQWPRIIDCCALLATVVVADCGSHVDVKTVLSSLCFKSFVLAWQPMHFQLVLMMMMMMVMMVMMTTDDEEDGVDDDARDGPSLFKRVRPSAAYMKFKLRPQILIQKPNQIGVVRWVDFQLERVSLKRNGL